MTNYAELTDAVCAVRIASRVTRRLQAALGGVFLTKDDRSPVTVADYAAQALVSLVLPPEDAIVGEETSPDLVTAEGREVMARVADAVRSELPGVAANQVGEAIDRCSNAGGATGRFWVLDPIDGTKGFLRGDQYAIALGLMEDGEVVGGVLGCPNLPSANGRGCLFAAARGRGAWELPLDEDGPPRRIGVSSVADSTEAVFCESAVSMHSDRGGHAGIAERLGVTAAPVRMDSQCKYGAIARGDASIYLRLPSSATYREKIWDHAAGFIVVTEAGGTVTDAFGRKLDFSLGRTLETNRGVVATNGLLHRKVLAAAAAVLPEAPAA
ncbi:MAG: 3'(2'),5'-bisphosphate nucleotidase [Holophagales bacterium]|nr:3'(2'),5'-bisphosphate nucleotidase [Holophagales bacterium]MYH24036.1 3'(2'),5'-bisphosphate nucleotidase [Holophagales bacterium]